MQIVVDDLHQVVVVDGEGGAVGVEEVLEAQMRAAPAGGLQIRRPQAVVLDTSAPEVRPRRVHPVKGNLTTRGQRDRDGDQAAVAQPGGKSTNVSRWQRFQRGDQLVQRHAGEHRVGGDGLTVVQAQRPALAVEASLHHPAVQHRRRAAGLQHRGRSFPELSGAEPGVTEDVGILPVRHAAQTPVDGFDALVGPVAGDVLRLG